MVPDFFGAEAEGHVPKGVRKLTLGGGAKNGVIFPLISYSRRWWDDRGDRGQRRDVREWARPDLLWRLMPQKRHRTSSLAEALGW